MTPREKIETLLREEFITGPGLCRCGCGRKTNLARYTDSRRGHRKGEPLPFLYGHRPKQRRDLRDYFEERDRGFTSPCWIWKLYINTDGYAHTWWKGERIPAHRLVYTRVKGAIPDGLYLDHLCRTPSCVNPDHLEPVTMAENIQRGAGAKLTPAKVREIRSSRMSSAALARRFGVGETAIRNVRKGRRWRNVNTALARLGEGE